MNRKFEILEAVRSGQISPEEAASRLKDLIAQTKLYVSRWVDEPLQDNYASGENCLILCEETEKNAILDEIMPESTVYVYKKQCFEIISDTEISINPDSKEDYKKLFEYLQNENKPIHIILHMWNWSIRQTTGKELSTTGISVLHLCKQLILKQPKEELKILYVYQSDREEGNPYSEAVYAIFKSIEEETTKLYGKTISFDSTASKKLGTFLLKELADPKTGEIRYTGKSRQVREYRTMTTVGEKELIRQGETYLIAGGAGALGRQLTIDIQKQNAKVIWCGRRQADAVKAIPQNVSYYSCDMADKADVMKLKDKLLEDNLSIKGIFLCTGMIKDSLLKDKIIDADSNVFRSKINAAINMDEAFQNASLDFFILYSSITSAITCMGQSDYAYANAFLNAFAKHRNYLTNLGKRKGTTISVSWPFFKDGGMKAEEAALTFMKNTKGILPLSAKQQYELLCRVYATGMEHVVIISGNAEGLLDDKEMMCCDKEIKQEVKDYSSEILSFLKGEAAKILKEDEAVFEENGKFSRYGFDSITTIEFINAVNQFYHIKLLPSVLYEYTKFQTLAEYLLKEYPDATAARHSLADEKDTNRRQEDKSSAEALSADNTKVESQMQEEELAIVGMAGQFPKSKNVLEFWKHLKNQESLIREVPADRWNWEDYYADDTFGKNKTSVIWGGFLENIDTFDEKLFKISPKEADYMNPQQRLILENVWTTIEDAGYKASELAGENIGVFIGIAGSEYNDICVENKVEISAYSSMGLQHSIAANRISYFFDFHGPSEAIDTACSSSLVALNRAVKAIRNGECDSAIVGGVNVMLTPSLYIAFDKAGMLSKTGKCRAFDKDADGFVRGEGVASIYIKPLQKALEDKDHIYGVIKGSCVNHGGDASSLTSPNTQAQVALLKKVYQEAGIEFDKVTYIETHGTGTVLGDSIEVNALRAAFKELHAADIGFAARCGLGSVKTNIGHLETAAGIAGIIKVLLAMKYGWIPGNVNFHEQSPMVQLENTPFYIVNHMTKWTRIQDQNGTTIPRIAGISSFGFGGTNAHVILEEYKEEKSGHVENEAVVIPISAVKETQLAAMIHNFCEFLRENDEVNIQDAAFTMQNGREVFPIRYAVYGRSKEELIRKLEQYSAEAIREQSDTKTEDKQVSILSNQPDEYYQSICDSFMQGNEINWMSYCKNRNVHRNSLPTYEFAPNSHWVKLEKESLISAKTWILNRCWEPVPDTNKTKYSDQVLVLAADEVAGRQYQELIGANADITLAENWEDRIGEDTRLIVDIRSKEKQISHIEIDRLLMVCKRLLTINSKNTAGYLFAYPVANQELAVYAAALESFFQALQQENPGFSYQVIGYDKEDSVFNNLVLENSHVKYEKENRYRLVVKAEEFKPDQYEKKDRLKENGVYIIFGGNGGIGKITAEAILEHSGTNVVLVGRSKSSDAALQLNVIYKDRILYQTCDIRDRSSLEKLRHTVIQQYKTINGLIHSAGQLKDNVFEEKTNEEFHDVIDAKIQGLINIDDVFKDDRLDFVLIYTSLAAYYGSQGQTDYCFANRFEEEFAAYRNQLSQRGERFGESVCIGWPFWKEVGMQMPETMVKRLHVRFGMLPIIKQIGKAILKTVWTTNIGSYAYFYGDTIVLPKTDRLKEEGVAESTNASIEKQLEAYMKNLFAELTGVSAKELGLMTTFEELGIDSLLTTQFTQAVQKDFGKVENTILFECTTIGEVVAYMQERHKAATNNYFTSIHTSTKTGENTETFYNEPVRKEKNYIREEEDIAIIGFDGRYANTDNLSVLWDNLTAGVDMTSTVPKDRWEHSKYYSPNPLDSQNGRYYCQKAGFLKQVDQFDPLFFHISPKEAMLMDPQERMLLETAWNTVEKAGYNKKRISKMFHNQVAAFVGVTTHTYNLLGNEEFLKGNTEIAKSEAWSLANRISYFMNWKGPSIAVDTACSSSLTALHIACESLKNRECQMAFVGSANLYLHPTKLIYMSQMKMLSESGVCSAFGENADGFVPGEAVGGLLIKTRKQAEADGDRIFGIIKAAAVNHDGMTNGYTVPNVKEQAKVIKQAIEKSGVHPATISYVEAHGTGTRLGDPIEIAGLTNAWSEYTDKKQFCAIGSVKSNIGHSEACAGLASITKVLLQMQHRQLTPSIHCEVLNSRIAFEDSPFYVQRELSEWKTVTDEEGYEMPRRAAISSFGAGGSNVHIIMEEYQNIRKRDKKKMDSENRVFTLSARNEEQLKAYADSILIYLGEHEIWKEAENAQKRDCKVLITQALSDILSVPAQDVNSQETFENYGMDRIQLHELVERLEDAYESKEDLRTIRLDWTIDRVADLLMDSKQIADRPAVYDIDLDDLIYTSHLKEEFNARLAIRCNSIRQLISGLISYIEGLEDGQYINGHVKQGRECEEHQGTDIARLWVEGEEIDWEEYDSKLERIDFPTYPFTKESYWIAGAQDISKGRISKTLDENLSTLQKQIYTKTIDKNDFYLRDHVVNHKETLPGVFYLQLVNEAAKLSFNTQRIVMKEVTWLRPIQLEGSSQTIRVEIEAAKNGCEFKIWTNQEIHMQGRAEIAENEERKNIPIHELVSACKDMLSKEACYHTFTNRGIRYGETFQGLQYVKYDNQSIAAKISLPQSINRIEEYELHPSIMDAALQATIGLSSLYGSQEEKTFLPFGFKEMKQMKRLEQECFVYIHNLSIEQKMILCDITITNPAGEVLLTFEQFAFRVLEEATEKEYEKLQYHKPEWVLFALPNVMGEKKNHVLVLYNGMKLSGTIAKNHALIYVRSGNAYYKHASDEYTIRPNNISDYEALLADLEESHIHVNKIIHLWSNDYAINIDGNIDDIMKHAVEAVFDLCKAVLSRIQEQEVEIIVASITKDGVSNPFFSGIGGFLKSVHLEHGAIRPHLIELEGGLDMCNLDMLSEELAFNEKAFEIRYDNGKRYRKKITAIPMKLTEEKGFKRDDMVYLITGALGGLSKHMLDMLCSFDNHAKFILTDILAPGEKSQTLLERIRTSGKQAKYIQADLTKLEDVSFVVQKGKEQFNHINCVIHTAGIIKDQIFVKKDFETFQSVLAPKVMGTLNLDEAVKSEPIRWFILFSSLAAFGNAGQCDYAYANEFLVKFEEVRNQQTRLQKRSGRTIAINWPLWDNGGMKTDKETEKLFEHFGMKALDSILGMQALQMTVCNEHPQVIVTQGDKVRIEKKLQSMFELREKTVIRHEKTADMQSAVKYFTGQILDFIKDILKIREDIDTTAEISEYGFDSISITDLVNKLNSYYELGVLPTQVFEYNTIEKFIENVYAQNAEVIDTFYQKSMLNKETEPLEETPLREIPFEENDWEVLHHKGNVAAEDSCDKDNIGNKVSRRDKESSLESHEPIAIVGMSGVMPGADDLDEFWGNLVMKKDVITEIPKERWNWKHIYGDSALESNKTLVNKAGFVKKITDFDEELFDISNREAKFMDPVQRIVLEESHRALEDAGMKKQDIYGTETGVYIGLVSMEYYERVTQCSDDIDPYLSTGNSRAVTANRLSYLYGLTGPSEVIDTACSSSLVAMERAMQDLRLGKCSMAIAGGVNVILSSKVHIAYSRTGMLSPDGRCRTFDQSANGYGRGEGCGILILKPLHKALEEGDYIHALLLGAAVNHTGHVNTLTTPNPNAQAQVITEAIEEANVPYQSIGYIETHGTGTKLGDPIEITGLKKAEEMLNPAGLPHPCILGAVKTNIGHLEGAAGIAGVIKTVMALKQNRIPANLNFTKQNDYIDLTDSGYSLAIDTQTFPELLDQEGNCYPRRAGVSSFGFGGVNAHVVLEAYAKQYRQISDNPALHVLALSGRTPELLNDYVHVINRWITENKEELVKDIGKLQGFLYTLQCARDTHPYRLAIVFETFEELIDKMTGYLAVKEGEPAKGIFTGNVNPKDKSNADISGAESASHLAEYFVTSQEMNWIACYLEIPDKLSLPHRKLKKNKHWVDVTAEEKSQNKEEVIPPVNMLEAIIRQRIMVAEETFSKKQQFEMDMLMLEQLSVAMLLHEFQKIGYFIRHEEQYDKNEIRKQLGILSKYNRLYEELIEVLCKQEYLLKLGTGIAVTQKAEESYQSDIARQIQDFKEMAICIPQHIKLLEHCVPHLIQVLTGEILATDVLFPDSSMELVKDVYANNIGSDYYNELVAKAVAAYIQEMRSIEPTREIKILEVGAGTGGTTHAVVKMLDERFGHVTYTYTDLSNAFLRYGQTMYGRKHSFMEFKQLDVERDPVMQGFHAEEYDVIIGANVLHATKNMQNTIRNLKTVLKPKGWIIVNEITMIQAFLSLTFGLTDGWWLFEDEAVRLQGGPLLSVKNWDTVFKREGFASIVGVDTLLSNRRVPQDVVIAMNQEETSKAVREILESKPFVLPKPDDLPKHKLSTEHEQQGLQAYVQSKVAACLADTLIVDVDSIDLSVPYSTYGVDSILGIECIKAINQELGIKLNTTDLFNYTDVLKLSEHIVKSCRKELEQDAKAVEYCREYELSILLDQFEKGEISIEDITEKLENHNG